jgi:hypothetical protein
MGQLIEYPVPDWIKILFLLAIPFPIILTVFLIKSAFPKPESVLVYRKALLFFVIYVTYVSLLGFLGVFSTVLFPPLVILLTTVPFAFFLFLYVAKTSFFKEFIANVALDKLVQVHIFRLIGVFFIILCCYDALPKWFSLIAGIGDMVTAIASLWIAHMIRKKHTNYLKITWVWNTFGLIDIIFTAVSANVLTKLSIDRGIMGVDTLAMFPFWYIPAIAPALIMFLHFATYQKLKRQNHFLT